MTDEEKEAFKEIINWACCLNVESRACYGMINAAREHKLTIEEMKTHTHYQWRQYKNIGSITADEIMMGIYKEGLKK